jgi:uncharacterized protein (TIGR00369 family)
MTTFTAATPNFEELVKAAVLSMPAAKHLGFDFGRVAPGEVEIVQPYREELTEHNGFFQAGVVGALADFAGGSAGITLLGPGWVSMTVDYTVKLVAPAKGEKIVARGRVIKPSRVMTVAAADVYAVNGSDEKLCATAFVTMRNIKLSKDRRHG